MTFFKCHCSVHVLGSLSPLICRDCQMKMFCFHAGLPESLHRRYGCYICNSKRFTKMSKYFSLRQLAHIFHTSSSSKVINQTETVTEIHISINK